MKETILIINPYLHIGGVERALISLLYTLPKDRYEVSLMLTSYTGEFIRYIPNDVKIEKCPVKKELADLQSISSRNVLKTFLRKRKYLLSVIYVLGVVILKLFGNAALYAGSLFEMNDVYYDYIFNFSGPDLITSILAERIFKCKKKYIWIHNEFRKGNGLNRRKLSRYERYDEIFAVSTACEQEFREIAPALKNKTHLLYNITSEDFYHNLAKEEISFNDDYAKARILSVGRLNYQKGFDIAVQVAANLKNKGYDFRWYIIGEGCERKKIEMIIEQNDLQENVILLGSIVNPYPFFRDCDIYVQTSRYEGYCLTIAEAKSFYKPIVTTDFAGAYDQIENGKTGLIVECEDGALTEAIENLLQDNTIRTLFETNLKKSKVNTSGEINKLIQYLN